MYLLFDIGGTKTRVAVTKSGKTFGTPLVYQTPKKYADALSMLVQSAEKLSQGKRMRGAAGGIAGPLSRDKTQMVTAVNIDSSWEKKPFVTDLGKRLKAPVILENDAAVIGLGEAIYGAGSKYDIIVYMTISTGIGGARITRQHIDPSAFGYEPGHQIVEAHSRVQCKDCGLHGDLEAFASGSSLKARYKKEPSMITDAQIWKDVARYVAIGLYNATVVWSPECIVVGGGITLAQKQFFPNVKKEFSSMLKIFPKGPTIKKAALGDYGGLYGAMALINQNKK